MQMAEFYQVMEFHRRAPEFNRPPNLALRQELTTQHREELVDAWAGNKSGAQGETKELPWDWDNR